MNGPAESRALADARMTAFDQWIRLWLRSRAREASSRDDILALMASGLRMSHSGSLGFAPQDIASVGKDPGGRDSLKLHFMGLRGASSPLPAYLTDPLERATEGSESLRDFLSLFENRMYQLHALALLRRRPWMREELRRIDDLPTRLRALAGAQEGGATTRRLGAMGLLARRRRSSKGLAVFLADQLGIDRVVVNDRAVAHVPNPVLPKLGEATLSGGASIGERVPVGGESIAISMGPVAWGAYRRHLGDPAEFRESIRVLIDDYLPRPMLWSVDYSLDLVTVPARAGTILGDRDIQGQVRLGHCGWLGTRKTETVVSIGGR